MYFQVVNENGVKIVELGVIEVCWELYFKLSPGGRIIGCWKMWKMVRDAQPVWAMENYKSSLEQTINFWLDDQYLLGEKRIE